MSTAPLSREPEQQRRVQPFDPLTLDRSVIALPLILKMKEDFEDIRRVKDSFPDALERSNAAVLYNPQYPGGARQAHAWTEEHLKTAADQALAAADKRHAAPASAVLKTLREEDRVALRAAVETQLIEFLGGTEPTAVLNVHASVARRLMAMNEAEGDPERRPIRRFRPERFEIIIDLNLEYPGGRGAAREWVLNQVAAAKQEAGVRDSGQRVHLEKSMSEAQHQYLFARLEARAIRELVRRDLAHATAQANTSQAEPLQRANPDPTRFRAIFHIWPDFEVSACLIKSLATVKADAAQVSYSALGEGITWAVLDSGIDATHRHFKHNIDRTSQWHRDFTTDATDPLGDENGHGTHVAGIIAGEWRAEPNSDSTQWPIAVSRYLRNDTGEIEYQATHLERISGIAPKCQLVSIRVLNENGKGSVSNIISAINHVQEINGFGRRLLIHGVNISLGHDFEPEWFACGQSPLCVEIDRLVKSGVVVVVAAGNSGYGTLATNAGGTAAGMALTINDPGNAELAITVGATHRDKPHTYGVSYFSSKGPTGDGRLKPDLVAPGEKIISCATGRLKAKGAKDRECEYVETSGTSMAAPHVSGAIAAFLSVRGEFIGNAERVKQIFMDTATDLKRDRYFQGAGLIDLMRAIQSV